ncbi:putative membrane protein [Mycobacteroides stephanolepidis]|uniref:Putative membrane protein n=1 Tax=[Mycobacterium] stephanolepidis TaxID=1520670 RepID=A0A1Z4ES08_9MYCO|nr:DoxX family protein [[Mycobacterium] stephanolepidis]BAX95747.1 putative membrane protein [[Mycobacterium] stephanolepidis]
MTASVIPGWLGRWCHTSAPAATVLIRFYVGAVFAGEGVLKFLRPDSLGVGRFTKAGIPAPEFFAALDGVVEIGCGVLLVVGLATRVAAAPMIVNMAGALLITKVPILWAGSALFKTEHGWWDFLHEARLDIAQLCGAVFLLLVGAGTWSLDHYLTTHTSPDPVTRRQIQGPEG